MTDLDNALGNRIQRGETYAGMASWGGATEHWSATTGFHTCRECNYWHHDGYNADGTIRMAQCLKAVALMNNKYTQRVPHYAKACKYFDPAQEPPPVFKEKK